MSQFIPLNSWEENGGREKESMIQPETHDDDDPDAWYSEFMVERKVDDSRCMGYGMYI